MNLTKIEWTHRPETRGAAYIQRLQSRRLVEIVGRGEVRPSENLFA